MKLKNIFKKFFPIIYLQRFSCIFQWRVKIVTKFYLLGIKLENNPTTSFSVLKISHWRYTMLYCVFIRAIHFNLFSVHQKPIFSFHLDRGDLLMIRCDQLPFYKVSKFRFKKWTIGQNDFLFSCHLNRNNSFSWSLSFANWPNIISYKNGLLKL
jgi:hypothetical protein